MILSNLLMKASRGFTTSSVIKNAASVKKSPLAILRKKTGYSITQCKKALELHEQDIQEAEKYLQKKAQEEGWNKAQKLEGRNTSQGLVGVHIKGNVGAMIELKCETDFVARNQKFHILLNEIIHTTIRHAEESPSHVEGSTVHYNSKDLNEMVSMSESTKKLEDLVALNIGKIGENIKLSRGLTIKVPENTKLASVTHPSGKFETKDVMYGRYGSIMTYIKHEGVGAIPPSESEATIARQLCQHIIGMNPETLGSMDEIEDSIEREEDSLTAPEKKEEDNREEEEEETVKKPISTSMMKQKFLLNDEITVCELLRNTGMEIVSFERFELGIQPSS